MLLLRNFVGRHHPLGLGRQVATGGNLKYEEARRWAETIMDANYPRETLTKRIAHSLMDATQQVATECHQKCAYIALEAPEILGYDATAHGVSDFIARKIQEAEKWPPES